MELSSLRFHATAVRFLLWQCQWWLSSSWADNNNSIRVNLDSISESLHFCASSSLTIHWVFEENSTRLQNRFSYGFSNAILTAVLLTLKSLNKDVSQYCYSLRWNRLFLDVHCRCCLNEHLVWLNSSVNSESFPSSTMLCQRMEQKGCERHE